MRMMMDLESPSKPAIETDKNLSETLSVENSTSSSMFDDEDGLAGGNGTNKKSEFDKSFQGSTTAGSSTDDDDEDDEDGGKVSIAKKETKAVLRLRLLVFDFLIVSSITVSLIVYLSTTRAQQAHYEEQYESASSKVIETFLDIAETKLAAVASLGVTLGCVGISGGHHRNQSRSGDSNSPRWPFVTLPLFQERASTVMAQSGALYLQVNPLVTIEQRDEWEDYVLGDDSYWIEEGLQYQEHTGHSNFTTLDEDEHTHAHRDDNILVADRWPIWFQNLKGLAVADKGTTGPFLPTWMTSPILYHGQEVNENILKNARAYWGSSQALASQSVVIDQFIMAPPSSSSSENDDPETALLAQLMSIRERKHVLHTGDPWSQVFFPIYDLQGGEGQGSAAAAAAAAAEGDHQNREPAVVVVGVIVAWLRWMDYFHGVLPTPMKGIRVVLKDSCGGEYTYAIDGDEAYAIGAGDLHNNRYNNMMRNSSFASIKTIKDGTERGLPVLQQDQGNRCLVTMEVYPDDAFHAIYNTNMPAFMTSGVVVIFLCTAMLFIAYDRLVERRQRLVLASAQQTNAIVSSLFPKNVRDRLMMANMPQNGGGSKDKNKSCNIAPNRRLKGYLSGDQADDVGLAPIADLFPHCTVSFSDISGFTAWSSTRDPAQVFILLQTVYQAFDKIAKRRKVFKVETIGDSYVAVAGLPEPQNDHATIMARFTAECRIKFNELVAQLETTLGPDTGDLSMRFGLHSGPVTAGVLRGDRARFQLFGDTVNTAARMESTGERDKIQVSHVTYGLLVEAGKQAWVKPRTARVVAKGKGTLRTYWLNLNARRVDNNTRYHHSYDNQDDNDACSTANLILEPSSDGEMGISTSHFPTSITTHPGYTQAAFAKKQERLVNWMCELFHEHIRKVVAMRKPRRSTKAPKAKWVPKENQTSLDEVAEIIYLPRFDEKMCSRSQDIKSVDVGPVVVGQLNEYISIIASHYHDNAFHNFEHACHVTMATNKFLKRIVTPDIAEADGNLASKLHNYTHGINSDPLTLLAIVFSALIHDVDHRGVSNAQLVKEHEDMGEKYRNKSVAEQNSLDLAWDLLMEDRFVALRNCIFTTDAELGRFRQVIVNVVLATDIFDPELNGLRKKRWERAFSPADGLSDEENNDLRATIVIEHIIQASDVSHTMQHWHIYRKWNKRLFQELYCAYCAGRMEKDPSTFWYQGETGFFDNYIIPLAKKLKDCQVFGVSSDECLNYATQNRDEWKEKGEDIVAEMMREVADMDIRPM